MIVDMHKSAVGAGLATAGVLLIPLLAMQFTDEVVWDLFDFVFIGALVFGTGFMFELVRRNVSDLWYRGAAGVALAAAFLLIWLEGAVGLVGGPGGPAGMMELGVLAIGATGVLIARFRPLGMARAMFVTAFAQSLVAAIALIAGLGSAASPPYEVLGTTGMFVVLFAWSGVLFWHAAREQQHAGAA